MPDVSGSAGTVNVMTTTNAIPTLQIGRTTLKVYRHPGDGYAVLEGPRGGVSHAARTRQTPMLWGTYGGRFRRTWLAPWGDTGLRGIDVSEAQWRLRAATFPDLAQVVMAFDEERRIDELGAVMAIVPRPREFAMDADTLRRAVASLLA